MSKSREEITSSIIKNSFEIRFYQVVLILQTSKLNVATFTQG
jgi:hypothetical protein